jgi:hypothetical protein
MVAPTAMHLVVVGQATDATPGAELGKLAWVQEVPWLLEMRIWAASEVVEVGSTPAAMHIAVVEAHVTPRRVVLAVGSPWGVQVLPPSFDESATPCPTATQVDPVWQVTASSGGTLCEIVSFAHVLPPSTLPATTPLPLLFAPTARHDVADAQLTALNAPWSGAEPPGLVSVGALASVAPPRGLGAPVVGVTLPAASVAGGAEESDDATVTAMAVAATTATTAPIASFRRRLLPAAFGAAGSALFGALVGSLSLVTPSSGSLGS